MSVRFLSGINVDSNTLFVDDSNNRVGIGTASPSSLLHVQGNVLFTGRLDFTNANVHVQRNGNELQLGAYSGWRFYDMQGSSVRMFLTQAGNLGVGTTSPSEKLHVAGNGLFTGGIYVNNTSAYLWNTTNGVIRFGTNNLERARIDASGNVGIGTTSPSQKLDVVGNILAQSSGYVHVRVDQTDSGMIDMGMTSGTAEGFLNVQNTGAGHVATPPEFKLLLNASEKMRVDENGNVGIGTSSPTEKLEVTGNVILDASNARLKIKGGVTGTNSGIDWTFNSDSTQYAKIELDYDTRTTTGLLIDSGYPMTLDYSSGSFSIKKNGTSELTVLNGNVGIGTTSPGTTLDIYGSLPSLRLDSTGHADLIIDRGSSAYDANLMFRTAGSTNFRLWMDAADALGIRDESTATEMVTFKAGGNVGIGTTSPADSLHVNGGGILNVGTTNTYAIHMNADSGSGPILTFGNSADYDAYGAIKHGSSQFQFLSINRDYNFLNNGSSLMLIDVSTGNVGINTTSPAASLHIEKTGDQVSSVKGMVLSSGAAGTNKFLPSITWSYGASGTPDFARLEVQRGGGVSGRMLFSVANSSGTMTEAMRIDDAARLGIGTTTPTTRLDLGAGNGAANGLSFGSSSTGVHRSSDGTTLDMGHWANVAVIIDTDNNDSSRHFSVMANSNDSTTATTLMRVLETGNVGIGTTSPYGRLHVYDSATGAAGMTVQNSTEATGNSAAVWFKVAGSTADYRKGAVLFVNDGTGYGRGDFYFASNTSTVSTNIASTADAKMVIKGATGNVGIGTTSPSYKLDVNGSFKGGGFIADDSTFTLTFNSVNVLYGNLSYGALPAASTFGTGDSGIVSDFPGSEVMRIASLGRVGINTTSPQANLHLNGSLRVDAPTNFANIAAGLRADPGNGIIGNDPGGLGQDQHILGTPDTWLAVNINGTDYAIPAYAP